MKQLLVLSGKGGTGKTTVAGAFIYMNRLKAFADCDVDAPNLYLISELKSSPERSLFFGGKKAVINPEKCVRCYSCEHICRFGAIKNCAVNSIECEGCGLCERICPVNAIEMKEASTGNLLLYKDGKTVFSTAELNMGSGATGKLVSEVKKQLVSESKEYISVVDGSPGIGCPVIASISGVYAVLIVSEPTVSGLNDLKRIIETVKKFGVKCAVCVNKYDVNLGKTEEIEKYCKSAGVLNVGRIPYDNTVLKALEQGKSVMAYSESEAAKAITQIWNKLYGDYIIV